MKKSSKTGGNVKRVKTNSVAKSGFAPKLAHVPNGIEIRSEINKVLKRHSLYEPALEADLHNYLVRVRNVSIDRHGESPWVKTSERKPDIGRTVFVGKRSSRLDFVSMAFFGSGEVYNLRGETFPISEAPYWMPIPPLPKEGKR